MKRVAAALNAVRPGQRKQMGVKLHRPTLPVSICTATSASLTHLSHLPEAAVNIGGYLKR